MDLWNIKTIRYLFDKYGCNFNKSLGQNFLISPWVCPKMAEMSGISSETFVIEVGPGIGVLTAELAKKASKVVSVELDKRLIPLLGESLSEYDNIKIINSDILKTDLKEIIDKYSDGKEVAVCANLPYYITSPVIMYLLESKLNLKSITVMVQKEVARRIVAKEGTRETSVLSLAIRYYSEPVILFDVPSGNFNPRPDVDSSVIRLDIRSNPAVSVKSEKLFFNVIKSAFSQRRKTAINSLSSCLGVDKKVLRDIFSQLEIDLNKRPENLNLENFRNISDLLLEKGFKSS